METPGNGWIHRKNRLPLETDCDEEGRIITWHVYQGAMLTQRNAFIRNTFCVYWMRVTDGTRNKWHTATERMPTQADADMQNCVFAKNKHGDICIRGYHQFDWNSDLTHWQPLPEPPSDYEALWKM